MEAISIYIHIPMCVKKCAYCDFTSFSGRLNQRDAYTDAVCREMRAQAAFFGARKVNTVFFGGGTPTLMTGGQTPWMLYFCGAALALVLTSIGIPALAFALGMFIPMELNAPLVVGGLVAWFVSGRSKDEGLNKARFDRGTLIASGFIAGGALMGVVSAVLKFVGVDWFLSGWASSNAAEWTGLAMYLVLIGYFAWHTLRAKKEE